MYNRSFILRLIGFDNLYPSVALRFQAIGFRHKVKSLGQNASPCGNPVLKGIISDVSIPCFVLTAIVVFHLLLNINIIVIIIDVLLILLIASYTLLEPGPFLGPEVPGEFYV